MKSIKTATLLLLPLLAAGCGPSEQEAVLEDYIDLVGEMTGVLETVEDGTTAVLAKSKLEGISRKMEGVSQRMQCLTRLTPRELQELFMDYQEPMNEAMSKLTKELTRVACITGVGEELQELIASMKMGST